MFIDEKATYIPPAPVQQSADYEFLMNAPQVAKEALYATRQLLEDRAHWTTLCLARDFYGAEVSPESDSAERWCILGALRRVSDKIEQREGEGGSSAGFWSLARNTVFNSSRKLFNECPDRVNDTQGHAAVLEILDDALAAI